MTEPDSKFLASVLGAYFSLEVNPSPNDASLQLQTALSDASERSRFRELLKELVANPQPDAIKAVRKFVLERPRSEEKARARLLEIWERCFGDQGILTDEAMLKIEKE